MAGADLLASLAAAALVLFVPGPTNTLLAAAGALAPGRPPLALPLAELAGYLVSVTLLAALGAPLLAAVPMAAPILRLGLAVYLVMVGCCLWRAPSAAMPDEAVGPRRVFVATLLNPKAAVFAFVLMPSGGGLDLALWYLGFALVVLAAGTSWVVLGHRIARLGGEGTARLVPRLAAAVVVAFALMVGGGAVVALV